MSQPIALQEKAEPTPAPVAAKSKGEKLFDRAVYGGLAGVGTFFATLYLTFNMRYGKWASQYNRMVDRSTDALGKLLPASASRAAAEKSVLTTALMMGGNAMLLPVWVAEHFKQPIVRGLNAMLGDTTPPDAIAKSPKQTFWSLFEGRMLAWGAVFGALYSADKAFPQTFKTFEHEFATRFSQLLRKPVEIMKDGKLVPSKTFLLGKIGAVDMFATAAAATILYVGGHFFARKHEEKKTQRKLQHGSKEPALLAAENDERSTAESSQPAATITSAALHQGMATSGVQRITNEI